MAIKITAIAVLLVLFSLLAPSNAAGHHAGAALVKTYNVMNFGAKPGSQTESTQAFMKAWLEACAYPGRARLLIPKGIYKLGETIFQGPCKSPIPVTILLQGTLQAVSDVSAYPDKGWISLDEVNGVILTGGGTIDGQGQNLWKYNDCKANPDCVHLPASLYMTKSNNVKIKSIHFLNSMGFHMHITRSSFISLHSLTITAPEDSPNTDGMHISQSNGVKVSRMVIKTGDDCVSVGHGVNNLTLHRITCGPGHGLSVGSLGKREDELDVRGLIISNCTLIGTTNGLRIKTFAGSNPSEASGFLFKDIIMNNVQHPIVIDQNYGSDTTKPSQVRISDVIYQNIVGTSISPLAVDVSCSSKVPCQNVQFHDINLKYVGIQKKKFEAVCTNAKVGHSGIQFPPPC